MHDKFLLEPWQAILQIRNNSFFQWRHNTLSSVLPLETLSSLGGSYQTPKQTWGILPAFLTHTYTNRQVGIHTQSPLRPFVQWDLHSRITEIAFYKCVGKREDFPWKHGRTHHRTKTHSRAIEYQEKHQIVLPCWRHGPSFIPISHIGYKMFRLNLKAFLCVWPW